MGWRTIPRQAEGVGLKARLVGGTCAVLTAAGILVVGIAGPATAYNGPVSQSYYVTAYDNANPSTVLYNWGYNAPAGTQLTFLEFGGVCNGSGFATGVEPYGGPCTDNYSVQADAEWWEWGFFNNPAHYNTGGVEIIETVNNSISSSTSSTFSQEAPGWYNAIDINTYAYSVQLDGYYGTTGIYFLPEAGYDAETNWDSPTASLAWVTAWVNAYNNTSDKFYYMDNGAYYGTCASSSCWNSVDDHGWEASQVYAANYGYTPSLSFPEMYDNNWGTYYADLNQAAAQLGGLLQRGPITFTGVMWGCGTGGNEPNAPQAYSDFSRETSQSPPWLTEIHNLADTC
jgi:hypothetical protein